MVECPYQNKCKQKIDLIRCNQDYDRCIIYQRMESLDNSKRARKGIERFVDRYGKDWRALGVGS